MARALNGIVVLAVLAAGIAAASGHAFLDRANPAVGSTVRAPPGEVRLWFTQALEPAFSSVQVVSDGGQKVDRGDAQVDPADRTVLRVSLSPLAPGSYKVIWRVLSVDTHVTEGDYRFRVAP